VEQYILNAFVKLDAMAAEEAAKAVNIMTIET
jgi:hypothetical protein